MECFDRTFSTQTRALRIRPPNRAAGDDLARPRSSAEITATNNELMEVVETEHRDWQALWNGLHGRLGCHVIQNNCVLPYWCSCNHELQQPGSLHRYLIATNLHLKAAAPPFVTIHDVESMAKPHGKRHWDDPRFAHQAKLPCARVSVRLCA